MSRWIYLEPDFPPTASEGALGRARSQAREREVGEGNPGTREGWGASDGLAGCPQTPSTRQASPCNSPSLLNQGQEEPSTALQPHGEVHSQAHLGTLGCASCPFNCQKEVFTTALKIICSSRNVISPRGPINGELGPSRSPVPGKD